MQATEDNLTELAATLASQNEKLELEKAKTESLREEMSQLRKKTEAVERKVD